jgi:hypothetical protein
MLAVLAQPGYGPHRTIYLTGIEPNGKVARASARRRFRLS